MGVESNMRGAPESLTLKVVKYGKTTVTKAASDRSETITINHNLGYVPGVIAFMGQSETVVDKDPLPYVFPEVFDFTTDGHGRVTILVRATDLTETSVTFEVMTPEGTAFYTSEITVYITYYLLNLPIVQ